MALAVGLAHEPHAVVRLVALEYGDVVPALSDQRLHEFLGNALDVVGIGGRLAQQGEHGLVLAASLAVQRRDDGLPDRQ